MVWLVSTTLAPTLAKRSSPDGHVPNQIPADVLAELEPRFGSLLSAQAHPSSQGRVWRAEFRSRVLAVKCSNRAAHARERNALQHLQGLQGLVPQLVWHDTNAIATTWIEGRRAEPIASTHRAAGASLRRLHDVPLHNSDPVPVAQAFELRCASWVERAKRYSRLQDPKQLLGASVLSKIRTRVEPKLFGGAQRVLCHRDVTPSNWLLSGPCEDPSVHLIDFGQARPDLALWDLVKLAAELWLDPRLREAFMASYGPWDDRQLEQLVVLHGLQTTCWGIEHQDAHFERAGAQILARCL